MKFFIATICTLLGCAFASPIELNPRGAEGVPATICAIACAAFCTPDRNIPGCNAICTAACLATVEGGAPINATGIDPTAESATATKPTTL